MKESNSTPEPTHLHVRIREPNRSVILALAKQESRPVSQMADVLLKEAIAARLAKRRAESAAQITSALLKKAASTKAKKKGGRAK